MGFAPIRNSFWIWFRDTLSLHILSVSLFLFLSFSRFFDVDLSCDLHTITIKIYTLKIEGNKNQQTATENKHSHGHGHVNAFHASLETIVTYLKVEMRFIYAYAICVEFSIHFNLFLFFH